MDSSPDAAIDRPATSGSESGPEPSKFRFMNSSFEYGWRAGLGVLLLWRTHGSLIVDRIPEAVMPELWEVMREALGVDGTIHCFTWLVTHILTQCANVLVSPCPDAACKLGPVYSGRRLQGSANGFRRGRQTVFTHTQARGSHPLLTSHSPTLPHPAIVSKLFHSFVMHDCVVCVTS